MFPPRMSRLVRFLCSCSCFILWTPRPSILFQPPHILSPCMKERWKAYFSVPSMPSLFSSCGRVVCCNPHLRTCDFREREKEKEREKCPLVASHTRPHLGSNPATWNWTGNWTFNLLVCGRVLQATGSPGQDFAKRFYLPFYNKLWEQVSRFTSRGEGCISWYKWDHFSDTWSWCSFLIYLFFCHYLGNSVIQLW